MQNKISIRFRTQVFLKFSLFISYKLIVYVALFAKYKELFVVGLVKEKGYELGHMGFIPASAKFGLIF